MTEAISNLEKHFASLAVLRDVCASIDQRLARVEEVSGRVEATVQRTEEFTAESLADSMILDMAATIGRQVEQAGMARTEQAAADRALNELCLNIDARLARAEDTLHRSEGVVAERLQELTARVADAEATIQRIERILSSRPVEQTPSRPFERPVGDGAAIVDLRTRVHTSAENPKPARGEVRAPAAVLVSRFASIIQMKRPSQLPWVTGLAAPVLVLVAALAIGSLFRTGRSVAPDRVAPPLTTVQTSTPVVPLTNRGTGAQSSPAVMANASRSTGERLVASPEQPRPDRDSAAITNQGPRYVGTLSITSIPSGASVSINGKPAGKTPLRLPRQRAGTLAVQIAHDGFERWSAAVLVPADQLTQVTATLRATPRVTRN